MMVRRRHILTGMATAMALGLALAGAARAQESVREAQVKAAFVFNFIQFVEWPAEAFADEQSPILVGIVGADPFKGALDEAIKGKTINKRHLVLRRFSGPGDLQGCHLLVISPAEQNHLPAIREKLRSSSTLLVGEPEPFLRSGGMIRLFTEENKIRFEINIKAAEQAKLKLSAKLLKLARIYQE